jgi:F-type H+-transporting ATPase subunit delta
MPETPVDSIREPSGNKARLARVYAEALLAAAAKAGNADAVGGELATLANDLVAQNGSIQAFFTSAAVSRKSKLPAIEAAFANRTSPLIQQFLGVLTLNGRLGLIREISQAYAKIQDTLAGRVRVKVTSSTPLSEDQTANLSRTLSESLNKTPLLTTLVDPELLGGLVVQVGDRVYDSSVRTRLETLRNHLLSSGTYVV